MQKPLTLILALGIPLSAQAYIGPGMGAGVIGVILGVATSIGLALIALFWYPLKRTFKRWFGSEPAEVPLEAEEPPAERDDIEKAP
jgi:hypothetical protein